MYEFSFNDCGLFTCMFFIIYLILRLFHIINLLCVLPNGGCDLHTVP